MQLESRRDHSSSAYVLLEEAWCGLGSSSVWKKGLCKDGTLQSVLVTVARHPLAGSPPAHVFPNHAGVALQPGEVDALFTVPQAGL